MRHKKPLALVNGGKKADDNQSPPPEKRTERLVPPKKLLKREQEIWDTYIEPAHWLQQCDALLAYMFVRSYCQYLKDPEGMVTARVSEMRRAMRELHITSSGQAGLTPTAKDPAEKFFD